MRAAIRTLLVSAVLALAPLPAARAGGNESGPNFDAAVGATLSAEGKASYDRGLEAYAEARRGGAGQTAKIAGAIRELKRVRDLSPKFAPACYYLGLLYQETSELEKARQVLALACQLSPSFHQAIVELGDVYHRLGKPDKALAEYERAILLEPRYGHAYTMRALARLRAGDFPGALGDVELAKKHGDPEAADWLDRVREIAKREVDGPGWATTHAKETEHYRVLTPVSQELADDIGKHAELIHRTYALLFPKIEKGKRKFTVLIFPSREAYNAAGGPPSAGGHYEPLVRKLVFFPHEPESKTRLVMYHEGFHQFIHDYLERPPQWFNEGLGDFFGPSRYVAVTNKSGKVVQERMEFRPNPMRLGTIQAAIQARRVRGWRHLMLMSQAELYEEEWAGIHYAQSWSIIYFLVRGGAPPGAQAGPYVQYLKSYFAALRRGDGQEAAFDAAFGKADVSTLEQQWKTFILGLRQDG